MTNRINMASEVPSMYKKLFDMEQEGKELIQNAQIEEGFSHLLKLKASQINKCAYCVRLHTKDALACGETIERISVVSAWEESDYFSLKERACLSLVEAITLVSYDQVSDTVYENAKEVLTKEELVSVEWLAILINSWNRLAISSRYIVKG
ncbi:carboxymuconolactone decarboxylase family protein [Aliarcobacter cryaerophilus]|jgi:AhpD family alkylhydroperoxidase|uniref:carboxymuconolactone decarboxylase family protein n=1 Tax=Aliarcobacter cryaerophilus TaxID=28198 RepID=UPI00112F615D|nr:carboxymuconolactone decarboxylase family protein [Aliarcobacter cryaerophilus]MBP7226885.1 carboxymuconolactone decarboxylase family protein [Aliarcobacter sp.]MBP9616072.1 carboxymuconolactone decarboxylase family protein [Aliarcobacter sp.]